MIAVYKITSPSLKVYIGQTWDFEKRYIQYKKLNCRAQVKLFNSFTKHGFEKHKFEIIYKPKKPTQEKLDKFEIREVKKYKLLGCSLNIRDGGSRGKHSEESKLKNSESRKGKCVGVDNPQYGKVRSEIHRERLSKSRKGKGVGKDNGQFGKIRSDEHRERLSKSLKGRTAWNKGKSFSVGSNRTKKNELRNFKEPWNKGKSLSEEHKKNIGIAKKGNGVGKDNGQFGKIRSDEHRMKISKSRKGKGIGNKNAIGNIPWNKGKSKLKNI